MNVYMIYLVVLVLSFTEAFSFVIHTRPSGNTVDELKHINNRLHQYSINSHIKQRPKRDALDRLLYEVVADTEKDSIEVAYDKSNIRAEEVAHRLNERIEHVNLVLTHLEDIAKHFKSVHSMANSLVESDATANFVKKFAIEQLNDSVNKIEKCDSCWEQQR